MLYYQKTPQETIGELGSSEEGLSRHQASERLKKYGLNEITIKGEPLWRKIIEPFANVFMAVLFVAALISVLHHAYLDAIIIGVIMLASASIYYIQRFSTERILRSLQKHNTQKVEVVRGGEQLVIDILQLVPGDIVKLVEGDKVPADLRLIHADSLRADESVLTGESLPIEKTTHILKGVKEVYERSNLLFQGSFIVSGQATGIVVATGNATEFGQIAALAGTTQGSNKSPVQQKIDKLVSYTIMVVFGVAVLAFILALSRGIELTEALRFVIALSVSAVPEGLPVAISVILALGMRRMAAKKALVRNMRAIETIGVITTIATDKTGTLTENKLSVQEVWQPDGAKSSTLAAFLYRVANNHGAKTRDPLDVALAQYAHHAATTPRRGTLVSELPFDQSVAMSGNVWHHKGGYELAVKGAPEHIIARSTLNQHQKEAIETALHHLTSQGYRVIAVASAELKKPIGSFLELTARRPLTFVGLLAVADTLRPAARRAIATAQRAGVTVRMITGDHFETAFSIGKKLGLVTTREQVFDGRTINNLSDKELAIQAHKARIFSRVTPENKYRILQTLKLKEVAAMTGDGVNDVPALASAHVGVAMGSGSQIAKDAGDIILLNDNFASIVRAMREGRIIFANIRRMLFYLLSTNIGEVITAVGALIIGLPMPLAPVQILWVNLVTDTTMVIPLGLEPGEKTVMTQKPASPKAPILGKYMISRIILVACVMGALALGLYASYSAQYDTAYGMTIAFVALVVVQWANAFNARSTYESVFTRIKTPSRSFWIGLAISIALQLLAIFGPFQAMLHVHPISIGDMVVVSAIAFTVAIAVVEVHKFFGRRYLAQKKIEA